MCFIKGIQYHYITLVTTAADVVFRLLNVFKMCVGRISMMIKAQGLISTREFGSAVTALKSLDAKPLLRDNTDMLSILGETHFYSGDSTSACATLQRVSYRYTLSFLSQ